jgi:hypothetical protein
VESVFDNWTQFAVPARGHVIATNNDKPKFAAPTLFRKSVEADWRPLDAPDRARAYAEQFPYVYRIACGSSRNLDKHFVTPAASTRLPATSHCESVQRRRTKAVLFSYPDRCRSAGGHPFNRPLGPGILGGNREHTKMNSNQRLRFSGPKRHTGGINIHAKGSL